jgi:prevent-host-death family protein
MIQVNIHEAKTHLSRLLAQVAAGEEVVIAKSGKPLARLTPISDVKPKRTLGRDLGLFEVPEDFNAPLPEEELQAFDS